MCLLFVCTWYIAYLFEPYNMCEHSRAADPERRQTCLRASESSINHLADILFLLDRDTQWLSQIKGRCRCWYEYLMQGPNGGLDACYSCGLHTCYWQLLFGCRGGLFLSNYDSPRSYRVVLKMCKGQQDKD